MSKGKKRNKTKARRKRERKEQHRAERGVLLGRTTFDPPIEVRQGESATFEVEATLEGVLS